MARPSHSYRDRRVKPGDDGEWAIRTRALHLAESAMLSLDLAFD
jgi:hypothetical protein